MVLSFRFRKYQLLDYSLPTPAPIYYTVNAITGDIVKVYGTLPQNSWVTGGVVYDDIEYSERLEDNTIKKELSGTITVSGDAFRLIKNWLDTVPYRRYDEIEVEVTDVQCKQIIGFFIVEKNDLKFCQDQCSIDISIRYHSRTLDCIRKTDVTSNWQGWFPQDGSIGTSGGGVPFTNSISTSGVTGVLNAEYGVATPYVRTLIKNVCDRCGLTINNEPFDDTPTSPTFGNGTIFTETTSPYYNAAVTTGAEWDINAVFPDPAPAIDRFQLSGNIYQGLEKLMSTLLQPHNGVWYTKGSTFYHHVKNGRSTSVIYDFTTNVDNNRLCDKICYAYTDLNNYRAAIFEYMDGGDQGGCGWQLSNLYNAAVDWNETLSFSNSEEDVLQPEMYNLYAPIFVNARIIMAQCSTASYAGAFYRNAADYGKHYLFIHDPATQNSFSPYAPLIPPPSVPTFNPLGISYDSATNTRPVSLFVVAQQSVFNYDYYFEPKFEKNLYWRFWHRESSLNRNRKGQEHTIKIRECCEDKNKLGIYEGQSSKLMDEIIIDGGEKGIIQSISIKGNCIEIKTLR